MTSLIPPAVVAEILTEFDAMRRRRVEKYDVFMAMERATKERGEVLFRLSWNRIMQQKIREAQGRAS